MEEIIYSIPALNPGTLYRIGAEDLEHKESIAMSMCREVATRYNTCVAYFCCSGRTSELSARLNLTNMSFIDQKNRSIDVICTKATAQVRRHFVRLVVIDSLDSLLEGTPEGERFKETKRILTRLEFLAGTLKVPVVILSDHAIESPVLGGVDLFAGATLIEDN